MQIRTLMMEAARELRAAGIPDAQLEARVLAGHALELDRVRLISESMREATPGEEERLRAAVARRAAGEPLAHVTGWREFYGYRFRVTRETLIPRPETEMLVEEAARLLPRGGIFADWGTGSGCVGVSLAAERPDCRGILLDCSAGALETARENARITGVAGRVQIVRGDMLQPCLGRERLDLVCSNPPYIAASEALDVMPEVRRYEPASALFSEENGLRHARALIRGAGYALKEGGWLLMEHGAGQGEAVRAELLREKFAHARTLQDFGGLDRCSIGRKTSS